MATGDRSHLEMETLSTKPKAAPEWSYLTPNCRSFAARVRNLNRISVG